MRTAFAQSRDPLTPQAMRAAPATRHPRKADGSLHVGLVGQRWTPKRKAALIEEILAASVTPAEACEAHKISPEELAGWMDAYGANGRRPGDVRALRVSDKSERRQRRKAKR